MVRPSRFQIEQSTEDAKLTISVTGELDMGSAGPLSDLVAERLEQGAMDLTLDLRELAFMDSSGLRALIELHDSSQREGWRLTLIRPREEAALLVIRATGADKALPFTSSGDT